MTQITNTSLNPGKLYYLLEGSESEPEDTLKVDPNEWNVATPSISRKRFTVSESDFNQKAAYQETAQQDPTPADKENWVVVSTKLHDSNPDQEAVEYAALVDLERYSTEHSKQYQAVVYRLFSQFSNSKAESRKREFMKEREFMKLCESVHVLVCKIAQSISSFFLDTFENLSLSLSSDLLSGPSSIVGRHVAPFRKFQDALQYL